jgi:hypothetical protein
MNYDVPIPPDQTLEVAASYGARHMLPETFEIYLDDDRYSVPTLHLVVADDPTMALAIATRLIEDSPHHLGAEVCLDGQRVAGLGSFALRHIPPGAASREPDVLE